MNNEKRVLIVEDRQDIMDSLKKNVMREGYVVDTATTKREALEKIRRRTYHVAMLDVNLSDHSGGADRSGIDIAEEIELLDEGTACIVISGEKSEEVPVDSIEAGVRKYIIKNRIRSPEDYLKYVRALTNENRIKTFGKFDHLNAYLARPLMRFDWESQGLILLGVDATRFGQIIERCLHYYLPILGPKDASYTLFLDKATEQIRGLVWSKAKGSAIWVSIAKKGVKIQKPDQGLGPATLDKQKNKGPENYAIWSLPSVSRDRFIEKLHDVE